MVPRRSAAALWAEEMEPPLERTATGALIDYLYSEGELSIPQYDSILGELKVVRDAWHMVFTVPQVREALPKLRNVVAELTTAWWPIYAKPCSMRSCAELDRPVPAHS